MTALLALGILTGIAIGVTYGYTVWGTQAANYALDLDMAEKHIRRLEDTNEGLAYKTFWMSEAERLRRIHPGTPYADGPGVRGNEYSAAWIDEDQA